MWRALRRLAGRLLPEAVKRPLRGRLFGFRPSRSHLRAEFAERGAEVVATVDGALELRVPPSATPELRYHLVDNGDSVDEIASLLAVARDPGGLLLDVGGHKGLLATLFCLASPRNRAVCYEPSPGLRRAAAQIRALNGLDDRLELNPAAIGDRPDRVDGYEDASGLIAFGPPPGAEPPVRVAFTTLDAECERLGVWPDVVKIDIEGYEDRALAGAARLLAEHPPILLLEFHVDLLDRHGARVGDLVDLLERHGYRFFTSAGRPMPGARVARSAQAVIRFVARPAK